MRTGECDVVITLKGVRLVRLPRLRTAIKSYIFRFGRECIVVEDIEEPEDGEQEVREVPQQGVPDG